MIRRPCTQFTAAGPCPNLAEPGTPRCTAHPRPGTDARGYGRGHQRERARWQARIDHGEHVPCRRCGEPVTPSDAWDLGHRDDDRAAPTAPEHAACNRGATAARRA